MTGYPVVCHGVGMGLVVFCLLVFLICYPLYVSCFKLDPRTMGYERVVNDWLEKSKWYWFEQMVGHGWVFAMIICHVVTESCVHYRLLI
jgi:hypothetical protein